jgi:hypothetical protein
LLVPPLFTGVATVVVVVDVDVDVELDEVVVAGSVVVVGARVVVVGARVVVVTTGAAVVTVGSGTDVPSTCPGCIPGAAPAVSTPVVAASKTKSRPPASAPIRLTRTALLPLVPR